MNALIQHNQEAYNKTDGMSYVNKPTQRKRIELAIEMVGEEVKYKSQKLLSVGCCTGDIEAIFVNMGLQVHGIDCAPEALRVAKTRGVITKKGDVSKALPYRDNEFDFVFAGEIIEHIMNTRDFLVEVCRVLKPGGFVVITTPNLARFNDRIRFLFGKSPKHTTPVHNYLYLHIRPFTLDSLCSALEYCGFEVKQKKSNYVYLGLLKANFLSRFLAKIFPGLGKTIVVKGQKNE